MRSFLIGMLMLVLANIPNTLFAEDRTECVLRSDLEREAAAFVENTAAQAEKEREVQVSQAAKDSLKKMVIEVVGESYKVVDTESDCPAGMHMMRDGETKD